MNTIMYSNLESERETLTRLLEDIPLENVIDRLGLENRLEEVSRLLDSINPYHISKTAKLTFRGKPVIGSEAISALFASNATKFFTESVAAVAAGLSGTFNLKGPIPNSLSHQLYIKGTAIGSFGFEFELPRPDVSDLCPEPSILEKAIDDIRRIFEIAALGSDDDLNVLVEEIHPRAVSKIHSFLEFIKDQDASCGLEFNDQFFKFNNEQLLRAISRLGEENIKEERISFVGHFHGILPESRFFEFKIIEQNEVIKGRISKEIQDAEVLVKSWLLKPLEATFTFITCGNSKPRYVLKAVDDLKVI